MEAADFIVVPAMFHTGHYALFQEFVNNAQSMLPLLGQKPHVLVLKHPLQLLLDAHRGAITLSIMSKFTLVASNNYVRGANMIPTNLVGAPNFQPNQWHQGAHEYRQSFDPLIVQQKKHKLMTASFGVGHGVAGKFRSFVRDECTQADQLCHFVSIDKDVDLVTIVDNMAASWYTLVVPGDWMTRSVTYQAVIAGSLLVVFEDDYMLHMPFRDLIDYSKFVIRFSYNSTDFHQQTSFTDSLQQNFDMDVALDQLEYMFNIRHVFQYSLNPDHKQITYSQKEVVSPWDDAFTFTIKALLRSFCKQMLLDRHKCNPVKAAVYSHRTVAF